MLNMMKNVTSNVGCEVYTFLAISCEDDNGRFINGSAFSLITNSSERPIIDRINNRYSGNDLLGTCSLHFTSQQYKSSNVMITIVCLKIVHH